MKLSKILPVFFILVLFLFLGCTQGPTFKETNNPICEIDGKPIIRMYSTSWCPHCQWVAEAFDSVAKEYQSNGLIVAHHWEVDMLDDKLTDINEGSISEEEYAEFLRVSPKGSIPAFSFGCKYTRLGNGYEAPTKDLAAEEKEFRETIDALLQK